jgi:putative membrane-bound dehydrogenase-like protein
MFAAFDERGRLFVAESSGLDLYTELQAQTRKCRIRLLEDRDGDGRFESSRTYVDKLVFPMGLAWRAGKLYVADPPDVAVYEDTDGDGTADQRTVILTGFGHKDNGSLHGLVFGPDGFLYMTMGSPDGYRLERPDGSFLEGESGALIRCRPDGSDPHVVCRGFENLVEVVFTPRGEIIGTDNWFRNVNAKGSEGLRDALVQLVDGGLYPYHREVGTPHPVTGDPLGAVSLFPAVALSGLARDRGPTFPEEFRGNLFSAQHNARKVGRHVLISDGSTFRSEDSDFLTSEDPDFHPSDVLQAADGSLLVVDTASWYTQHCPTGNIRASSAAGGIYRVRRADVAPPPDPWGKTVDWPHASTERLIGHLADERPSVRDRAHLGLVSRGEAVVPPLVESLDAANDAAFKQRIIWALSSISGDRARQVIRKSLDEADDVAAAAARALASLKDSEAASALHKLLARDSPQVRLAAGAGPLAGTRRGAGPLPGACSYSRHPLSRRRRSHHGRAGQRATARAEGGALVARPAASAARTRTAGLRAGQRLRRRPRIAADRRRHPSASSGMDGPRGGARARSLAGGRSFRRPTAIPPWHDTGSPDRDLSARSRGRIANADCR